MSDIETFHRQVDRIDTGLDGPDPGAIAGLGQLERRRRRPGVGIALASGALAVAAVAEPGLVTGGEPDHASVTIAPAVPPGGQDAPAPAEQRPDKQPAPALDETTGPEFGEALTAAVSRRFPAAELDEEVLGDHQVWVDRKENVLESRVSDRVDWEALHTWSQSYQYPAGVILGVAAERLEPGPRRRA